MHNDALNPELRLILYCGTGGRSALAAKTLRHAPEKWAGLQDKEARYRMRYVDLFANPEVRDAFVLRSKIIRETRAFFDSQDYIEVETPILQPIFGGAAARPFETYHNTSNL